MPCEEQHRGTDIRLQEPVRKALKPSRLVDFGKTSDEKPDVDYYRYTVRSQA